jgi:hypothetical protein
MRLTMTAAAIAVAACSSSDDPSTPAPPVADASTSPVTTDAGPVYAPSPYGVEVGDTIANLSFSGWSAAPYTTAGAVRFSDFYDPAGSSGRKMLVVNVCSVWCVPCQKAYADFREKAADYAAKGVAFLSVLYENADVKPISADEGAAYATKNGVGIPVAIDPAYQLSNAVRPAEVPSYIVISVRDMKVLGTLKSADAGPWAFVDQKLSEIK